MEYEQSILRRLKEHTVDWCAFDRPEFLDDLNELADECFNKNTVEGYLAALLIYHQLFDCAHDWFKATFNDFKENIVELYEDSL
jgi:hypothetical protein